MLCASTIRAGEALLSRLGGFAGILVTLLGLRSWGSDGLERHTWFDSSGERGVPIRSDTRKTTGDASEPIEAEYFVVERGDEWLVARYVWAPNAVSFNRSTIRRSLESIRAEWLRPAPFERCRSLDFVAGSFLLPAGPTGQLPGLSPAEWVDASPPGDFRVTVALVWWRDLELE